MGTNEDPVRTRRLGFFSLLPLCQMVRTVLCTHVSDQNEWIFLVHHIFTKQDTVSIRGDENFRRSLHHRLQGTKVAWLCSIGAKVSRTNARRTLEVI